MKLSILIATTVDRRNLFVPLYCELFKQSFGLPVEIIYLEDNKEISIGTKRQKLLEMASGEYIVFFDSDDEPMPYYVSEILQAIETNPDCVGLKISMTTNGVNPQTCFHSRNYPTWYSAFPFHYRNVTHFNPVKRELALQVGFKDMRFGEDKEYADRLTPLCNTEVFIDKPIFHYKFINNIQSHNQKYGIK